MYDSIALMCSFEYFFIIQKRMKRIAAQKGTLEVLKKFPHKRTYYQSINQFFDCALHVNQMISMMG